VRSISWLGPPLKSAQNDSNGLLAGWPTFFTAEQVRRSSTDPLLVGERHRDHVTERRSPTSVRRNRGWALTRHQVAGNRFRGPSATMPAMPDGYPDLRLDPHWARCSSAPKTPSARTRPGDRSFVVPCSGPLMSGVQREGRETGRTAGRWPTSRPAQENPASQRTSSLIRSRRCRSSPVPVLLPDPTKTPGAGWATGAAGGSVIERLVGRQGHRRANRPSAAAARRRCIGFAAGHPLHLHPRQAGGHRPDLPGGSRSIKLRFLSCRFAPAALPRRAIPRRLAQAMVRRRDGSGAAHGPVRTTAVAATAAVW
jgi:hypothetical protein